MSETKRKQKPAWLTGEDAGDTPSQPTLESDPPEPRSQPSPKRGRRTGPLAEEDTTEMSNARKVLEQEPQDEAENIPRVTAPGSAASGDAGAAPAGGRNPATANGPILERIKANPEPLLISALVLVILAGGFWFFFLRGGGEDTTQPSQDAGGGGGEEAPLAQNPSPQAGGVDETGIVFSDLQVNGDEANLRGAGLEWEGSVIQKDDGAGETITLEGPTAAQIERGFEVENSDVESGVYALAQDDGSVLHVSTHTYQLVSAQKDKEGDEQIEEQITLGTIFDLSEGELDQHGFYIDRHQPGSAEILRTYYSAPDFDRDSSYEVTLDAPRGAPVPLLVGYREQEPENSQEGQGEE